jgi:hypothetical protein
MSDYPAAYRELSQRLVPDDPGFSFADAKWDIIAPLYPFLGAGVDAGAATTRYGDLMENTEETLACILNLCEAMSQIVLSQGTPLDYIKQLRWDAPFTPAQDRFFAWCDPRLIDQGEDWGCRAPVHNCVRPAKQTSAANSMRQVQPSTIHRP